MEYILSNTMHRIQCIDNNAKNTVSVTFGLKFFTLRGDFFYIFVKEKCLEFSENGKTIDWNFFFFCAHAP